MVVHTPHCPDNVHRHLTFHDLACLADSQDLVEAGKAAEALAALQELEGPSGTHHTSQPTSTSISIFRFCVWRDDRDFPSFSGAGAVSEVVYESVVRCCAENRQWQLALQVSTGLI